MKIEAQVDFYNESNVLISRKQIYLPVSANLGEAAHVKDAIQRAAEKVDAMMPAGNIMLDWEKIRIEIKRPK